MLSKKKFQISIFCYYATKRYFLDPVKAYLIPGDTY